MKYDLHAVLPNVLGRSCVFFIRKIFFILGHRNVNCLDKHERLQTYLNYSRHVSILLMQTYSTKSILMVNNCCLKFKILNYSKKKTEQSNYISRYPML